MPFSDSTLVNITNNTSPTCGECNCHCTNLNPLLPSPTTTIVKFATVSKEPPNPRSAQKPTKRRSSTFQNDENDNVNSSASCRIPTPPPPLRLADSIEILGPDGADKENAGVMEHLLRKKDEQLISVKKREELAVRKLRQRITELSSALEKEHEEKQIAALAHEDAIRRTLHPAIILKLTPDVLAQQKLTEQQNALRRESSMHKARAEVLSQMVERFEDKVQNAATNRDLLDAQIVHLNLQSHKLRQDFADLKRLVPQQLSNMGEMLQEVIEAVTCAPVRRQTLSENMFRPKTYVSSAQRLSYDDSCNLNKALTQLASTVSAMSRRVGLSALILPGTSVPQQQGLCGKSITGSSSLGVYTSALNPTNASNPINDGPIRIRQLMEGLTVIEPRLKSIASRLTAAAAVEARLMAAQAQRQPLSTTSNNTTQIVGSITQKGNATPSAGLDGSFLMNSTAREAMADVLLNGSFSCPSSPRTTVMPQFSTENQLNLVETLIEDLRASVVDKSALVVVDQLKQAIQNQQQQKPQQRYSTTTSGCGSVVHFGVDSASAAFPSPSAMSVAQVLAYQQQQHHGCGEGLNQSYYSNGCKSHSCPKCQRLTSPSTALRESSGPAKELTTQPETDAKHTEEQPQASDNKQDVHKRCAYGSSFCFKCGKGPFTQQRLCDNCGSVVYYSPHDRPPLSELQRASASRKKKKASASSATVENPHQDDVAAASTMVAPLPSSPSFALKPIPVAVGDADPVVQMGVKVGPDKEAKPLKGECLLEQRPKAPHRYAKTQPNSQSHKTAMKENGNGNSPACSDTGTSPSSRDGSSSPASSGASTPSSSNASSAGSTVQDKKKRQAVVIATKTKKKQKSSQQPAGYGGGREQKQLDLKFEVNVPQPPAKELLVVGSAGTSAANSGNPSPEPLTSDTWETPGPSNNPTPPPPNNMDPSDENADLEKVGSAVMFRFPTNPELLKVVGTPFFGPPTVAWRKGSIDGPMLPRSSSDRLPIRRKSSSSSTKSLLVPTKSGEGSDKAVFMIPGPPTLVSASTSSSIRVPQPPRRRLASLLPPNGLLLQSD